MNTNAFVTYMVERLNADLTREQILDMTNKAQNEILSHDNNITRIKPDPNVHTGSESLAGAAGNTSGLASFTVTADIETTIATKGFLQIEDTGGVQDKYEYQSYSGAIFILADDVFLNKNYTTAATVTIDQFDVIASGALFSSVKNERNIVQFDVRRVSRVYAYSTNIAGGGFFRNGYGGLGANGTPGSRHPEFTYNINDNQIEIPNEGVESSEPNTGDAKIVFWEDNSPPTNPTQQVYFCRAQRWPKQLINEDVPLEIPDRFQTTLLRFAILKDEEYREYGRDDNPEARYKEELKDFLTWAQVGSESTTKTHSDPRF